MLLVSGIRSVPISYTEKQNKTHLHPVHTLLSSSVVFGHLVSTTAVTPSALRPRRGTGAHNTQAQVQGPSFLYVFLCQGMNKAFICHNPHKIPCTRNRAGCLGNKRAANIVCTYAVFTPAPGPAYESA